MRLQTLLRNDQFVVAGALAIVALLAWAYMLAGAGVEMEDGSAAGITTRMVWTPGHAAVVFAMWWIMMVAMMLPSAAPTILLFSKIAERQREAVRPVGSAAAFTLGYLLVWGAFGAAATLLQWALATSGLLSHMMASASQALSGAILIAAGLWQLTPLKLACLRHCRSPLHFVVHRFRPGTEGAVRMGAEHGLFCLGCCWFLMLLLFYGGVMNLYWIAGLALYVLVEKLVPAGEWIGRAAGVAVTVCGVWVLIGP